MFEFITNPEERGQVGIGTLIVFIAMVLVAAIAAGVLINTAGFLQTQAEATGEDSTDLVSERIDVNSEVGIVGSKSAGTLDEIRLGVTGAPGADQIDLAETTIQVVGPGGQENLVFTDTSSGTVAQLSAGPVATDDSSLSTKINYEYISALATSDAQSLEITYTDGSDGTITSTTVIDATAGSGGLDGATVNFVATGNDADPNDLGVDTGSPDNGDTFEISLYDETDGSDGSGSVAVGPVTTTVDDADAAEATTTVTDRVAVLGPNEFAVGSDGSFESSPVLSDEDDYTILVNPDEGAFNDGSAFNEGQSATLDIVSPAGATTQVELRAPDLFSTNGEAVRL